MSLNLAQKSKDKSDIAETHIDNWVYEKASPNVNALPHGRTNEAPNVDKYWEGSQAP